MHSLEFTTIILQQHPSFPNVVNKNRAIRFRNPNHLQQPLLTLLEIFGRPLLVVVRPIRLLKVERWIGKGNINTLRRDASQHVSCVVMNDNALINAPNIQTGGIWKEAFLAKNQVKF